MNGMIDDELIIIQKPEYISWEEITELLHLAFKQRLDQGLEYVAAKQDVETTIKRAADNICLVALINNKLVGTATLQIKKVDKNNKKWFYESSYGYLNQLAVHPEYKSKGIGGKLQSEVLRLCYEYKVDAMFVDTSVHAKDLLSWYRRMSAQKVEYLSHPTTNYYSVRFRTPIMGKKFRDEYVSFRYLLSELRCKSIKTKNGQLTLIGRVTKLLISKIR